MAMLIEEYDGQVPRRIEELVRLPGVARKTANVVAAELGEPQGVVVDTHVRRLSQRLGFTREEDPVKIERDLQRLVPRADWGIFPHLLIWHGRRVCIARRAEVRGLRPDRPLPREPRVECPTWRRPGSGSMRSRCEEGVGPRTRAAASTVRRTRRATRCRTRTTASVSS